MIGQVHEAGQVTEDVVMGSGARGSDAAADKTGESRQKWWEATCRSGTCRITKLSYSEHCIYQFHTSQTVVATLITVSSSCLCQGHKSSVVTLQGKNL